MSTTFIDRLQLPLAKESSERTPATVLLTASGAMAVGYDKNNISDRD